MGVEIFKKFLDDNDKMNEDMESENHRDYNYKNNNSDYDPLELVHDQ
nr:2400_t:CDS:2 [Entrophospora candida]